MDTTSFTSLQALRKLQLYDSAETLTPALHKLCSRFGNIAKLAILTVRHEGEKQAICFLRLTSEAQEQALMKALGVGRFGGEIVIVVNLKASLRNPEFDNNFYWQGNYSSRDMAFPAA